MNIKSTHPKAENVVRGDRQGAIACIVSDLRDAMRAAIDSASKSCLNCMHFDEKSELCGRCNQRPPARIIVLGCEQHEDEIPF